MPRYKETKISNDSYKIDKIIEGSKNGNLEFNDFDLSNFEKQLYIKFKDKQNHRLGAGGVGLVYLIENYAIKENNPCNSQNKNVRKYCNDMIDTKDNNGFLEIPGGYSYTDKKGAKHIKKRYILPNLYAESVIGMLAYDMKKTNKEGYIISTNFASTLGAFTIYKDLPIFYQIMPIYKPIILNNTKLNFNFEFKPDHYYYMLFQVAHGLLQAQEKYKFTHYDLHSYNLLYSDWDDSKTHLNYPIPNRTDKFKRIRISKKNCPFIIKIADFGLSRLETKTSLITSIIDIYPNATFDEFNPSYDLMSFIGSTIFDTSRNKPFIGLWNNPLFKARMTKFLVWYFKEEYNNSLFKSNILNVIRHKYYQNTNTGFIFRPKSSVGNIVNFYNTRSLVEVINYLLYLLPKFDIVTKNLDTSKDILMLRLSGNYEEFVDVKPYIPDSKIIQLSLSPLTNVNIIALDNSLQILEGVARVNYFEFTYKKNIENYNFTITDNQIKSNPYQQQYLTEVIIDSEEYLKKGYQFDLPCCKIDPVNYLRLQKLFGVVINGGFFNIGYDYLPIGSQKYPIPENYKKYYGKVSILNDGKIIITKYNVEVDAIKYFLTGPFLIMNGEIVFTNKTLDYSLTCTTTQAIDKTNTLYNNVDNIIYEEHKDFINVDGYYTYDKNNKITKIKENFNLPDCSGIKPGELKHASNPNPRSALLILNNGNYIFLTLEGRGERGMGMDLVDLAKTIKALHSNVVTAINLDGGRSTNLTWRSPEDPNGVYVSNIEHMYQYSVGNILSLTRPIN